jgi:hypothetical protein
MRASKEERSNPKRQVKKSFPAVYTHLSTCKCACHLPRFCFVFGFVGVCSLCVQALSSSTCSLVSSSDLHVAHDVLLRQIMIAEKVAARAKEVARLVRQAAALKKPLLPSALPPELDVDALPGVPPVYYAVLDERGAMSGTPPQPLHFTASLRRLGTVLMFLPLLWVALALFFYFRTRTMAKYARQSRRSRADLIAEVPFKLVIAPEPAAVAECTSSSSASATTTATDAAATKSTDEATMTPTTTTTTTMLASSSSVASNGNGEVMTSNEACCICLDEFETPQQIKVLPCRHGFHGEVDSVFCCCFCLFIFRVFM